MFAYNEGTVQNFGIINPTYEFYFESVLLYKAANIVGLNRASGNVNHVYVIDYRPTALVSGIRMVAASGKASGILFDNYGTFSHSYYASRVVMNASYGSRFEVQPVLYENHGWVYLMTSHLMILYTKKPLLWVGVHTALRRLIFMHQV